MSKLFGKKKMVTSIIRHREKERQYSPYPNSIQSYAIVKYRISAALRFLWAFPSCSKTSTVLYHQFTNTLKYYTIWFYTSPICKKLCIQVLSKSLLIILIKQHL